MSDAIAVQSSALFKLLEFPQSPQLRSQTSGRLKGFQYRVIVPAQFDGVRGTEQN